MNIKKIIKEELEGWEDFDTENIENYTELNIGFTPPLNKEEFREIIPQLKVMGVTNWISGEEIGVGRDNSYRKGGSTYRKGESRIFIPNVTGFLVVDSHGSLSVSHSQYQGVNPNSASSGDGFEFWPNGREIFGLD